MNEDQVEAILAEAAAMDANPAVKQAREEFEPMVDGMIAKFGAARVAEALFRMAARQAREAGMSMEEFATVSAAAAAKHALNRIAGGKG